MKKSTPSKKWEEYRELIGRAWATSVQAILELARLFAEAEDALADEDFSRLLKSLPFSGAKMSMLRQIGGDTRLYEKRVMTRLPASYSIMYQVHLLDDDELEHALEAGILWPGARREDIEKLRLKRGYSKLTCPTFREMLAEIERPEGHAGRGHTEEPDCESVHPSTIDQRELLVFGELLVPRDFMRLRELNDSLLDLVRSYGIEFVPAPGRGARLIHQAELVTAATREFRAKQRKGSSD